MMPEAKESAAHFAGALAAFLAKMEATIKAEFAQHYPNVTPSHLETMEGPRFVKIVCVEGSGSRSSWAFIEKATGSIFKANSWTKPAKHARGNIFVAGSYAAYDRHGPPYLR